MRSLCTPSILAALLIGCAASQTEEKPYVPQPAEVSDAAERWLAARRKPDARLQKEAEARLVVWAKTAEGREVIRKALADKARSLEDRRVQIETRRNTLAASIFGMSPKDNRQLDEERRQIETDLRALKDLRRAVLQE